jgi:hypothetical protein
MEAILERCCGIDVHKSKLTACLLVGKPNGKAEKTIKTFVQKVLEDTNIKLSSVATDIFGVSGREMLSALLEGESTPEEMAKLAKGRLRKKIPTLVEALRGNVSEHHRCLIEIGLQHLEDLAELISKLDERIDKAMEPYQEE